VPPWVQHTANIATLVSFAFTIPTLATTFSFTPIELAIPDMPFGGSVKAVIFVLASMIFAVAFADWYHRVDIKRGWDRFLTTLLLGFLSAVQTFALLTILLGGFEGNAGWFRLGLVVALALETREMIKKGHDRQENLLLLNALFFAGFSIAAAVEAHASGSVRNDGPIVGFLMILVPPIVLGAFVCLFQFLETQPKD